MNNSEPLVSIIMAIKNAEPYLATCLESICQQSYQNWELIAVNDHSSDGSKDTLIRFAKTDHRIRPFDSDCQLLIPALKYGYARSKGELITRMDADDIMPDYKIKLLVDTWRLYGKGHIAAGAPEHFVDAGEVGDGFKQYDAWLQYISKHNLHWQEIYKECTLQSNCWLMHRADFDTANAFNPEIYPEDYDLAFRLYKAGFQVHGLAPILHYWRDHSDRISRNWKVYKDNRYYNMKLSYFLDLDRDITKPLVLWGAGKNGKDLAKILVEYKQDFQWICDNDNKIGHNIYGQILKSSNELAHFKNSQVIIAVNSPEGKKQIAKQLSQNANLLNIQHWFFG